MIHLTTCSSTVHVLFEAEKYNLALISSFSVENKFLRTLSDSIRKLFANYLQIIWHQIYS